MSNEVWTEELLQDDNSNPKKKNAETFVVQILWTTERWENESQEKTSEMFEANISAEKWDYNSVTTLI